ncbi:hypothetical protein G9P44_005783 [Scheffersomyces stipitis]|nr:hypothetical protein G9P44_005783 [Scheffersomyces stipitis]
MSQSGVPLKNTNVFKPVAVGQNTVSNRIVYVPTTRMRATADFVPSDLELKYYEDRAQYPGTLLITEATYVSERAGLYDRVPGIWNEKQTKAWKQITDAIHKKGSFVSCQLWFLGRVGDPALLKKYGHDLVGASAVYPSGGYQKKAEKVGNPLRALTRAELKDIIVNDYINAAKNAFAAGFDYIELHGAHGYFLDTFLHPSSNQRTDDYGGSIEKRARFVLEVIDELIKAVGANRVALRISPWAMVQGVGAQYEEVHPITTFSYLLNELQKRANQGNELAYISVVEPRVQGTVTVDEWVGDNSFVRHIWKGVIVKAGNYTYDAPSFKTIQEETNDDKVLVGFSRYFTSNPDLVSRLAEGKPLTKYERPTFYTPDNWGYNTWSNHDDKSKYDKNDEKKVFPRALARL